MDFQTALISKGAGILNLNGIRHYGAQRIACNDSLYLLAINAYSLLGKVFDDPSSAVRAFVHNSCIHNIISSDYSSPLIFNIIKLSPSLFILFPFSYPRLVPY